MFILCLKAIEIFIITISKQILSNFWVKFGPLPLETVSVEQFYIIIIDASKWIIVIRYLVVFCAIQDISYTALAKRLLDKLVWDVLSSFMDPLSELIKFHPPNTIFKGLVDCNIQGLQHTCHPSRNYNRLCIQQLQCAVDWW